jgi:hypothetical protein
VGSAEIAVLDRPRDLLFHVFGAGSFTATQHPSGCKR